MTLTADSVWNECLLFIKDNIKPQAYKTWFEPIKPVKISGEALTIQVPSKFFYEWLEEHYIKLLRVALVKQLGTDAKLIYDVKMENNYSSNRPQIVKIPSSNRDPLKSQKVTIPLESNKRELRNPFVIPGLQKVKIESQLNPNYNFDNFVEGDSNRLARSAGMAVANKPGGTSFNPLLIYGGVGLGKTHLSHAIGVDIKDKYPDKTVLYISSEKFTQQFIDSVKSNTRNDFIHFYQMIDVLIIDDVQFLCGKEKTQDVFFHIFNHLHQNGKQIILTSDKAPVDIIGMEQRLLSRFKWGLSADLQAPDLETRIAVLNKKMYQDDQENKNIYLALNSVGAEDGSFYGADSSASWWHRNFRVYAKIQQQAKTNAKVFALAGQGHTAVLKDFVNLNEYQLYCCGAPQMVEVAHKAFIKAGLPEDEFYSDAFTFAAPVKK